MLCLPAHMEGPLTLLRLCTQHSYVGKATDIALGVAIPLHSHVAINSVLSDYVPRSVKGALQPKAPCMAAEGMHACQGRMQGVIAVLDTCSRVTTACTRTQPHVCAGAARWGALASSTVMFVGLLKLNLMGPGITPTVKQLWKKAA